jgi:hypothetical protein
MKFYKNIAPKIAGPNYLRQFYVGLMASQNWDDHDRSEYTALAMAKAYLTSCDPNAILFTIVTMTPSRSGMRKKLKNQDRR